MTRNNRAPDRPRDDQPRAPNNPPASCKSDRTAIYTLAGAGFVFAGSIISATIAYLATNWSAKSAFSAAMVQVGVGILSADPSKTDVAPARQWAIDLVEEHSGRKLSDEDRRNLLHHAIQTAGVAEGSADVRGAGRAFVGPPKQ